MVDNIFRFIFLLLLMITGTVAHAQFSFIDVIRDGDEGIDGLSSPSHIVISPDNKYLYVAGAGADAIAVFERDTITGELTFVEAVRNGENDVEGLGGIREITISADGQYLYAVADVDDAITVFSRILDSGKLAHRQTLKDGVDGVDGLGGARALAISPDGDNIYVAASVDGAVSVFLINEDTGLLNYVQTIKDGDALALELNAANGVIISPDNKHVYTIGNLDDGVSVFERDVNDQGRLTNNVQNIDNWASYLGFGNARPTDIVISDNGENVYVSGYGGLYAGNLTVFSRNENTGKLTIEKKFADETSGDPNFTRLEEFGRLTSLALNPENSFVYTTGDDSDNGDGDGPDFRILSFKRTSSTSLSPFKGIYNNANGVEGLEKPKAITFSTDGNFFYVVSEENALTVFGVFFPSITSFSPKEGFKNTEVMISGDDFGNTQGNSTVKFGDVTAEVVTWSNTDIVVKVPAIDAGEVDINVTVNNFTHTSVEKFLVKEIIVQVKDFMPGSGKTGIAVAIKGENLGTDSDERKVFFGDMEATDVQWISSDSVTAVVPAMEEDGAVKIKVMVNDMVGSSDADFIVDNTSPLGVLTYSDTDRKVQTGEKIRITATFNEPVADEPVMEISFMLAAQEESFPMMRVSETVYTYDYEVGEGDGQVSIHLQAGTDVHGNAVEATPENNTFTIDNDPPMPAFSPDDKAVEVSTEALITISFEEAVRNIDNSSITDEDLQQIIALTKILMDTEEPVSFTGSYDETTFALRIVPESLEKDEVYQVKLQGSLLEDEADNPADGGQVRFTTGMHASLHFQFHQNYLDQATKGEISIEVNDTNLVRTAHLYARGICSDEDWQGPFQLGLEASSYYHEFDTITDSIGIEYYYFFVDKFDAIHTDTLYIYKEFTNGTPVDVQAGENQHAYQLISFPLVLDRRGVVQVFDALGPYDEVNWRLFTIGENGQFVEYPDFQSVEPGNAYLLIFKDANITTIHSGKGHTVEVHKDKPFEIPVHPGWNLIGNPFNFDVSWDAVVNHADNAGGVFSGFIREYSPNWESTSHILPGRGGGLVHVDENTPVIKIPVSAKQAGIANGRKKEKEVGKNQWEVPLTLQQESGDMKRTLAGFGMHPAAHASRDKYDVMSPPPFGNYLDVNFYHPEYFHPCFAKDIVPFQDSCTWEFNVETNLTANRLTLSWNEKDLPADEKQIYLLDMRENKVMDMRSKYSYSFINSSSHAFKVFYGTQEFIDANVYPHTVSLHASYPNPFYDQTIIPFTIPKSERGYHVKMRIYHISGKQVVTLKDELMHTGFYEIRWDGTDASGNKMESGIYLCELLVNDRKQMVKKYKRLLLLAP